MAEWLDENVTTFQKLSGMFANPYHIGSNFFSRLPVRPIRDVSNMVMDKINEKIKELYDVNKRVIVLQTNEDHEKEKALDESLIEVIEHHIDILKYNYITECIYDENCTVCYKRLQYFIGHLEKQIEQLKKKEYKDHGQISPL